MELLSKSYPEADIEGTLSVLQGFCLGSKWFSKGKCKECAFLLSGPCEF